MLFLERGMRGDPCVKQAGRAMVGGGFREGTGGKVPRGSLVAIQSWGADFH